MNASPKREWILKDSFHLNFKCTLGKYYESGLNLRNELLVNIFNVA